jgi:hypothetical protein
MLTQDRAEATTVAGVGFAYWWLVAVGSVMLAVLAASLFSPDLVTGSAHEQIPIAAMVDWLWGAIAIGYLAFVRRDLADASFGLSVAGLWFAVAATSIWVPELVTGTDPSSIPLAVFIAPAVGTMVTGFLSLHALSRRDWTS